MWSFLFSASICWIHCIDHPKTFNLLLKSKIIFIYMCIESNTYRIGKVRIEFVSYRQGPYRIRIVSARSVSNTYSIGKVCIEYESYRQGPYRMRIVSTADRIVSSAVFVLLFMCFTCLSKNTLFVTTFAISWIYLVYVIYCKICDEFLWYKDTDLAS